ncbi:hypothetical protein ACJX0J_030646, partial [Zea mays]
PEISPRDSNPIIDEEHISEAERTVVPTTTEQMSGKIIAQEMKDSLAEESGIGSEPFSESTGSLYPAHLLQTQGHIQSDAAVTPAVAVVSGYITQKKIHYSHTIFQVMRNLHLCMCTSFRCFMFIDPSGLLNTILNCYAAKTVILPIFVNLVIHFLVICHALLTTLFTLPYSPEKMQGI